MNNSMNSSHCCWSFIHHPNSHIASANRCPGAKLESLQGISPGTAAQRAIPWEIQLVMKHHQASHTGWWLNVKCQGLWIYGSTMNQKQSEPAHSSFRWHCIVQAGMCCQELTYLHKHGKHILPLHVALCYIALSCTTLRGIAVRCISLSTNSPTRPHEHINAYTHYMDVDLSRFAGEVCNLCPKGLDRSV